ncbi:3-keto-disaccharide hydrolase [Rubinisphaera italica]|uniref:3-keto-alpha-glucoside-1,2-lyase/3-keto-2-hydroxy-glucal hydratase domain-containing protein n=1 Tax=Rubinisphaera italica TaxID=2527969 RepID=A0A5C5XDE6_9PLAN|nr:DUF1080 domain-containing protein [Rubinisphaera italica]TWT60145.1 hypothetical protein Pan54_08590 [Rubinisphaera italica]
MQIFQFTHLQFCILLGCGISILSGCESPQTPSDEDVTSMETPVENSSAKQPMQPATDDFAPEEGYRILTLADFNKVAAEEETWTQNGTSLISTGVPKGYLQSHKNFKNFSLIFEFRFLPKPGLSEEKLPQSNTGVLVYIGPEQKIWPESVEIQGKFSELASIKSNGGIANVVIEDNPKAREQVRHPVGEWNEIEVISLDGTLTSFLNGTKICKSAPGERSEGTLGFQAEGFPLEFRRIRIAVK